MVWNLAHSAGAVPVQLNKAQADFAVGLFLKALHYGYKPAILKQKMGDICKLLAAFL